MGNCRGQGLIEYLILTCLIAISAIAVVTVVGTNIKQQYARVSAGIRNGSENIPTTAPEPSTYQKRGMNDFLEGAHR